ncbi:MAG: hypothetical protein U1F33_16170 [Alphaproteobacteria bacterium]
MSLPKVIAVVLGAGFLLSGCAFSDDILWPKLTGGDPAGKEAVKPASTAAQPAQPVPGQAYAMMTPQPYGATQTASIQGLPYAIPSLSTTQQPVQIAAATPVRPAAPQLAQAAPSQAAVPSNAPAGSAPNTLSPQIMPAPVSPTGTFVGQKVMDLRNQLGQLQQTVAGHNAAIQGMRIDANQTAERYHGLVAAINARLQIGTTPGNPVLLGQWSQAQIELDHLNETVGRMNAGANAVAGDSSIAAFILESVRAAYSLQGAVEEDHRQLNVLEDETNRTVVTIDRILNDLSNEVARQSVYVGRERSNLTALSIAIKNGEMFGQSLANRSLAPGPSGSASAPPATNGGTLQANRRPLVVIRFDNPKVEYEQALYTALKGALDRRPDATFEVVAVAPLKGPPSQTASKATSSKRNADKVMRSLTNMGLPANRITMTSATSEVTESSEVHIYVR